MAQPGDVLHYSNYRFEDGSTANKFFIVLCSWDIDVPCLVLKTTSQPKHYPDVSRGCNPSKRVFFVPSSWGQCFKRDTYVQLPQIIEIPTEDLLTGSLAKVITVAGSLQNPCFVELRGCLKRFREDISLQHWKWIFES